MKTTILAALAALLTACGGGSGESPTDAATCYVAGQPAEPAACTPQVVIQPPACAASKGCR